MRAFKRRGQTLQAKFSDPEMTILQALAAQLVELVGPLHLPPSPDDWADILGDDATSGKQSEDPAIARLFPDAYRDDPSASQEFRRYTQSDQAGAKARSADTVAHDIAAADDGWVTVEPSHIDDWLTTLTNLRLVLASRLHIEHESDADDLAGLSPTDPRTPLVAAFEWCGWLLQSILECL